MVGIAESQLETELFAQNLAHHHAGFIFANSSVSTMDTIQPAVILSPLPAPPPPNFPPSPPTHVEGPSQKFDAPREDGGYCHPRLQTCWRLDQHRGYPVAHSEGKATSLLEGPILTEKKQIHFEIAVISATRQFDMHHVALEKKGRKKKRQSCRVCFEDELKAIVDWTWFSALISSND